MAGAVRAADVGAACVWLAVRRESAAGPPAASTPAGVRDELGVGLAAAFALSTVQGHHEVVARAGRADVQQSAALVGVHLLVDRVRRPRSRWSARWLACELDGVAVGRPRADWTPRGVAGLRGHAGQDDDRELQSLGARGWSGRVRRRRRSRAGRPRRRGRSPRPGCAAHVEVGAQPAVLDLGPRACLVDDEPEASPRVAAARAVA